MKTTKQILDYLRERVLEIEKDIVEYKMYSVVNPISIYSNKRAMRECENLINFIEEKNNGTEN